MSEEIKESEEVKLEEVKEVKKVKKTIKKSSKKDKEINVAVSEFKAIEQSTDIVLGKLSEALEGLINTDKNTRVAKAKIEIAINLLKQ